VKDVWLCCAVRGVLKLHVEGLKLNAKICVIRVIDHG
jgi:hypothetical protein